MIFKSTIGSGLTGTLKYIQGPGRDEQGKLKADNGRARLLGGQGFGFEPRDDRTVEIARRLMEQNASPQMQGHKTHYCEKDALHISLSWARGQKPGQAEQIEASKEFLKALGMEKSMAMYYSHDDKSYAHVHIIASRIDPETGMAYDDYQRMYKGMHRAIEWEREKNQITKQREWCHRQADATRGQVDHEKLFEELFKNEATVTKAALDRAFAFGGNLGNQLEAKREQFIKDQNLIRLKKYQAGKVQAYTTSEIWQEEARTLAAARQLKERSGYGVEEATLKKHADGFTLTEEQRKALWHATRDNGLSIISGQAGTGKSRTLQAIRKAYQEQGHNVKGLAFTNKVTQGMQRDGFDSSTIASELLKLQYDKVPPWNEKTVIMPDEAAQLSTKDMDKLMYYANKHKSKVIMVGDSKQLGAIEKGGLFPEMERRFGSTELTEVMRNKDPEQKRAYNKMHERKFKEAVDIFQKSGSIKWNDTKEESLKQLVEQYTKDYLEDPKQTQLMLAGTNDDVKQLNEYARELRKEQLGKDRLIDTTKGPRKFAVGDRITMNETPNKQDKAKGLINGAFGQVTGIKELQNGQTEMEIRLDRKKDEQQRMFRFKVGMNRDEGEVSGIDHGYASTVYKSQGDTLQRTYVMHDPSSTAPTNYVELSRHADRTKLYVSREGNPGNVTPGQEQLADQLRHGADKTSAHVYQVHEEDRPKLEAHKTPSQVQVPKMEQYRAPEPMRWQEPGKTLEHLFGNMPKPQDIPKPHIIEHLGKLAEKGIEGLGKLVERGIERGMGR